MFSKSQLEDLEDLLDGRQISEETRKALSAAVASALWSISRFVPRKDQERIEHALREGKLQRVGTSAILPSAPKPTRTMPEALKVKDGASLLAVLGLTNGALRPNKENSNAEPSNA